MKKFSLRFVLITLSLPLVAAAQDVIPLYPGVAPGSTPQDYPEKQFFSQAWHTDVVTNVTQPSLIVFKPSAESRNGSAIVICPGGGFMALSISSEGTDVAKYLAARGVTAVVLEIPPGSYRRGRDGGICSAVCRPEEV